MLGQDLDAKIEEFQGGVSIMEEEKEYILIEFEDGVVPTCHSQFSLTGLDTINPIMQLEDGTKLVGWYEDTVGTCLLFSEQNVEDTDMKGEVQGGKKETVVESNPLYSKGILESQANLKKRAQPVCCLQKRLKFRVLSDNDNMNFFV